MRSERRGAERGQPPPADGRSRFVPMLIAVLLFAGGWLYHRHRLGRAREHPPSIRLLVGIDVSGSVPAAERRRNAAVLLTVIDRFLPARAPVLVWSFDRVCRKHFEGHPDRGMDLWPMLQPLFDSNSPAIGTRPATVLQQHLREARQAHKSGEPVAILLLWDGEDADVSSTREAVKGLGALPNIRAIWVHGVATQSDAASDPRIQVESQLAPLGDGRPIIITGPHDLRHGFEAFGQALQESNR